MRSPLEALQSLGRALMLPIAVLPVAGLLLRLGQPDLLNIPFVAAAGDAIFSNLGLLFAAGVAVGLARDNNGAAGLAGVVCFLIATQGAQTLLHVPADALKSMTGAAVDLGKTAFRTGAIAKLGVPIGITSGIVGGLFYNRFSNVKLPDYLAFFGGRRFVPIVSGVAGLAIAGLVGGSYEALSGGLDALSHAIVGSGRLGLFIYGLANRALIVTGLHHILNNVAWFMVGDFHGATGDLKRFFAGDPTAGSFMAGFFPVMMFGLPAACLAMYQAAPKERRREVGGMLLSMALTSFLTGVTEPIEFTFMFLAPLLFALHAVLTGVAFVVMSYLGVKLGFGFSAGLFDYVLNFGKATRPLLLVPVGLVYFGVYYGTFRWAIARFDLKTPGRGTDLVAPPQSLAVGERGAAFATALGGAGNLVSVDACTTRLRLVLADPDAVDEAALRALGARGFVRPSRTTLQVVLGPIADQVAGEIRSAEAVPAPRAAIDADAWLAALGGRVNVTSGGVCSTRVYLTLSDPEAVDDSRLHALGARALARPGGVSLHILVGSLAEPLGLALGLPPLTAP
ncbi:N-acetylglucosamine-specific PTS transporter subunit IIBC [Phenylobacterium sp.]|jgi:PTS system N-acetylglucosamine-specific IIC component|uniref:N-acetylglucosamine-specific PTS transporter subunit IIBC n=1 Tax=Phenylobacterium sp. TaxID=1871053 RepID=UPI002E342478|nr:N-acetylglucosamine-specific PTS transporter subunit IIBC [Phenylobacterium sp.]HEX3367922.1 N-acetylglucosamine-specific PTS transporter subunit IIBC [Phenylobacterium sp.]